MPGLAHLYRVLQKPDGDVIPSATVTVLEPGTETPIANTLYSNRALSGTTANPFTVSDGIVNFYLDTPKAVRLRVNVNGAVQDFEDVLVLGAGQGGSDVVALPDLSDVSIPERSVDNLGNVLEEGPIEGEVLTRVGTGYELRAITHPDYSNTYAPKGYAPPFFIPQVILDADNRAIPATFPRNGLVHDTTKPDAPLIRTVAKLGNVSGTVTLSQPAVALITEFTLTGSATLAFPASDEGTVVEVWARQDATGGREITNYGSATIFPNSEPSPTLIDAPNGLDMFQFTATGAYWRMTKHLQFGTQVAMAAAPTIRGSGADEVTLGTSLADTFPSGIVTGDIGWAMVERAGSTSLAPTFTGWDVVETTAVDSHATWLYRRVLAPADSGQAITATFEASTNAAFAWCVVADGAATGQVVTKAADSTTDQVIDVPGFTPTFNSPLVLFFAGLRINTSTAPTVSGSQGWDPVKTAVTTRSAAVNNAVLFQAKRLNGQNGLAQAATTGATSVAAFDHTYLIQVPPA